MSKSISLYVYKSDRGNYSLIIRQDDGEECHRYRKDISLTEHDNLKQLINNAYHMAEDIGRKND